MKVELHLHTCRFSMCAVHTPREAMNSLVAAGYGAAFITEHDSMWDQAELDELRREFPQIRIFPGVELSVSGHHLLVLGTSDPAYLALGSDRQVLERAAREGLTTVLAHPFRWAGGARMLEYGLRPDAMEYMTGNQGGQQSKEAMEAAADLNIPLVNCGDSHAETMINRFWIETDEPLERAGDLREIIRSGWYRNCTGERI